MDAQRHDFDAVIVGAGMTGATLALALARAGLAVAVVEAQPLETRVADAFDGRASAIASANLSQWRALGVAEALAPHAQPIRRVVVCDGPGAGAAAASRTPAVMVFDESDLIEADLSGRDFAGDDGSQAEADAPLGWMVENRHIRAALNGALEDAGAHAFAPAEVAGVRIDARRAQVDLADGRTLSAALVIGADGRDSRVRQAAGIGVNGWDYPQSGVVATVKLATPHEGVAHQDFLADGPLAILPLKADATIGDPWAGDRASLVWTERTARADALVEASPEAFEAHLARRFGARLGRPRLAGPRFAYPLRLQTAQAMTAPRTALVGDAAHVVHPVAGQGLNLGLKDAAALAEVLVDARRLGEDMGSEAVLDRYARWRRFDAAGLMLATDLLTRLFSNDDPLLGAVRGAGLRLVNRWPRLRRTLAREAAGRLGDLPRLLRGEAL